MLKNYFRIAFRNLFRQKAYSIINLFGLALGISCGLLLTLHIREELSYEKSFSKHDRIFRIQKTDWAKSNPPLAGEMQKYFPEIAGTARFSGRGSQVASAGIEKQMKTTGYYADSTVADMFDLNVVAGDPVQALSEPYAVVITQSMAHTLFGNNDPVNQKLTFNNEEELWVKAVIKDMPSNTHLQFDYLVSMSTFYKTVPEEWTSNRGWMFGWTYLLLNRKEDITKVKQKLNDFWMYYYGGEDAAEYKDQILADAEKVRFMPLTDIHLHSNHIQEMSDNSSILYIYILSAVEILIILIACVNFINLFTTQAIRRLKEVGIRKILGARKPQLVLQFLGEALILSLLSGILALVLFQLVLPFYNSITGKQVTITEIFQPGNLLIWGIILLATGLLSGLFPAFFIAGFDPAISLKAGKTPRSSAQLVRKGLVVFQFVVSAFLIISTMLIYRQMNLLKNKDLGFDKEQVLVMNLYGNFKEKIITQPEVLENEILKNPDILAVAKSSNLIGEDFSVENVTPLHMTEGKEYPRVKVIRVDEQYLNVLNISLKAGRNFSREFNDSASFIINETAAAALGLEDPVGATLVNHTMDIQGKVAGVVKDFHFNSLHNNMEPLVLEYKPLWTSNMLVKIKAGKIPAAIAFLEKTIKKIAPHTLFSYNFLDDRIDALYKKEDNLSKLLWLFAGLAIVISCIGIFGLSAYAAEIRTREISIRKVIGASLANLVNILSREFILLVIAGNLLAWPLAWYAVNKWLQEFAYRIDIGWPVFVLSTILSLVIAIITISWHSIRTALSNPVKYLKTE